MIETKIDLTAIDYGVILHQCNCYAMGAGLAKNLYAKWPVIKESHTKFINQFPVNERVFLLGEIDIVDIIPNELTVINCFSQLHFRRFASDPQRYTDYCAVRHVLSKVRDMNFDRPIYMPALFGAGLAGGDPKIIQPIIKHYLPNAIICHYTP